MASGSDLIFLGVVPVFLGRVLRGESLVVWGDGTIVRDFLYISDNMLYFAHSTILVIILFSTSGLEKELA